MIVPEDELTAGQLRAQLRQLGLEWIVDPALTDEDRLPVPPVMELGSEGLLPETAVRMIDPGADIGEIIREMPPTNPWLMREWADSGLIELPADFPALSDGSDEWSAS